VRHAAEKGMPQLFYNPIAILVHAHMPVAISKRGFRPG
jgi:hypothetical protein